jgi:hypothetical protein
MNPELRKVLITVDLFAIAATVVAMFVYGI